MLKGIRFLDLAVEFSKHGIYVLLKLFYLKFLNDVIMTIWKIKVISYGSHHI